MRTAHHRSGRAGVKRDLAIADNLHLPLDAVTQTIVVYGGKGMGKRLALDTPIPTPSGWTTMGELSVGTIVMGADGRPCRVTYVSPVALGDSYRVTFSDDSCIVADAEHLWATETCTERRRGAGPSVRTTEEIRATLMHRQGRQQARNHAIRNALPLQLPAIELPVDPYVLGLWLGDGASAAGAFSVSTEDEGEIKGLVAAAGYDVRPHRVAPGKAPHYGTIGLKVRLRELGVLDNKHVPLKCLRASVEQRLALLQGLLDSDGNVNGSMVEFNNTNESLARGVYELVVSLGMKATWAERRAVLDGKDCGPSYRVYFVPTMQVFRLRRKACRLRFDRAQRQRRVRRYVTAVDAAPAVPMRCISVDSRDRLYLAGRAMVPTHNTNFGSVLAEELHAAGQRFSLIDPMGVAWGLQHGAKRGQPGLPVLILGGTHGDLPIEPTAAAVVADLVVDESVSVVVDISRRANGKAWSKGEKIRFVTDYCTRIYERQVESRRPFMQIIDEAARYAPQQLISRDIDTAKCLGAIEMLVEEGRNLGIGVTLLTQRSARLNKNVAELADVMVAFRVIGPNSIGAVVDWLGEHIDKSEHKEVVAKVRSLPRGDALVVSPGWLGFEDVAHIRARQTFDSSATPKSGTALKAPGQATKPDLDKYRERLSEVVAKALEDDPRELKKRVAALEHALKTEQARPTQVPAKVKEIKVPLLDTTVLKRAEKLRADLDGIATKMAATVLEFGTSVDRARREIDSVMGRASSGAVETYARRVEHGQKLRTAVKDVVARSKATTGPTEITAPMLRILNSLAWWLGAGIARPTRHQVAFGAKYTVNGHFNNVVGEMNGRGLLSFPEPGKLSLTDTGAQHCGPVDSRPPSARMLATKVLEVLREEPQRRVFSAMLESHGGGLLPVSRESLASKAGYTVNGHFNNVVGSLHRIGVFAYPQQGRVALGEMFDIASLAGAPRHGT